MNRHYLITIDRGHLRIYAESKPAHRLTPDLQVLEAMDFVDTTHGSANRKHAAVGRAGGSKRRPRLSLRERLPLNREGGRRHVGVVAAELNEFLRRHPNASWDFAGPPNLYGSIIEELAPDARRRLKRVLAKALVHKDPEEVRAHFALAAAG